MRINGSAEVPPSCRPRLKSPHKVLQTHPLSDSHVMDEPHFDTHGHFKALHPPAQAVHSAVIFRYRLHSYKVCPTACSETYRFYFEKAHIGSNLLLQKSKEKTKEQNTRVSE